jgi:AcrR family transcriptional regulator
MPASPHQQRPNTTEERIREVALRLFAQKGFPATSIRDIASEAGLAVSALYYYVGTKEELLLRIIQETIETLLRSARPIETMQAPTEQKLAFMVLLHVWFHGTRSQETQVVNIEYRSLTGDAREEVLALRDSYEGIWRKIVVQGNAEGIFQVAMPKLAAITLIEMGRGIAHWYRPDGVLKLQDICYAHVDWALSMLRAQRNNMPCRVGDLKLVEPSQLVISDGE